MSLVKFNTESFIAAMEPGLSSFIVQQFKKKLEEKLNNIVEETYAELEKELPIEIETRVRTIMNDYSATRHVHIEVDLTDFGKSK